MKHLTELCAAAILTLTFALSASAGEVDCPVVAPSPPATATGDIQYPVTQLVAESLIQSVLSLF